MEIHCVKVSRSQGGLVGLNPKHYSIFIELRHITAGHAFFSFFFLFNRLFDFQVSSLKSEIWNSLLPQTSLYQNVMCQASSVKAAMRDSNCFPFIFLWFAFTSSIRCIYIVYLIFFIIYTYLNIAFTANLSNTLLRVSLNMLWEKNILINSLYFFYHHILQYICRPSLNLWTAFCKLKSMKIQHKIDLAT